MTDRRPADTPPRTETIREAIARALAQEPLTARALSERVHIPEREVAAHLEHLARSARGQGRRLLVTPSRCLGCGFTFERRDRLTKPGSCPSCRGTRISPPSFQLG